MITSKWNYKQCDVNELHFREKVSINCCDGQQKQETKKSFWSMLSGFCTLSFKHRLILQIRQKTWKFINQEPINVMPPTEPIKIGIGLISCKTPNEIVYPQTSGNIIHAQWYEIKNKIEVCWAEVISCRIAVIRLNFPTRIGSMLTDQWPTNNELSIDLILNVNERWIILQIVINIGGYYYVNTKVFICVLEKLFYRI